MPILDVDTDIFRKVVDIKVAGTFLCTRAAIKSMIEQGGGKIVNISSTAGKRGSSSTLAYNAANFAVVGMTQSMAWELGPYGINVNCVCPGAVDTSRMDDIDRGEEWAKIEAGTAIGRGRHSAGGRGLHSLPVHRGCVLDSGPVDQRQRRHGHGALTAGEGVRLFAYLLPRRRGSRASRTPSPNRLNDMTVSVMRTPGKTTYHHRG